MAGWLPGMDLTVYNNKELLVSHIKSKCSARNKRNPGI